MELIVYSLYVCCVFGLHWWFVTTEFREVLVFLRELNRMGMLSGTALLVAACAVTTALHVQ